MSNSIKKLAWTDPSTHVTTTYDITCDVTMDTKPIENSTNPITSGAVYNLLGDLDTI